MLQLFSVLTVVFCSWHVITREVLWDRTTLADKHVFTREHNSRRKRRVHPHSRVHTTTCGACFTQTGWSVRARFAYEVGQWQGAMFQFGALGRGEGVHRREAVGAVRRAAHTRTGVRCVWVLWSAHIGSKFSSVSSDVVLVGCCGVLCDV